MMLLRARLIRSLPFFLLPLSFCLAQGCAAKPASLVLHPAGKNIAYAQNFAQAYAGKTDDGSTAFLLVSDDAGAAAPAAKPGAPLRPSAEQPLRQVVYIKVLWRPLSGTRESAATNAAIDWYVLSNTVEGGDDLLLYQGAGYVTVDPGDKATKVNIRSADLKPTLSVGHLADPIGRARLTGSFAAPRDNRRLHELLTATRSRTSTIASSH